MAKTRNRYRKNSTSKYKKRAATPQHMAQTRIVKMEKRLTPFVKKDENGRIVGFEFPEDASGSVSPVCPKCHAPMELKKPREGQQWKPFWGCTQYSVTGCTGSDKDIVDIKPQEPSKYEPPTLASVVGNQSNNKEFEIVKKNKEGKYIVNRSIQDESNGTLSWNDVIDLIDEALDDGDYPEEIVNQLNAFREKILNDIYAERGLFEARRAPKKPAKPKEEVTIRSKSAGHTYNELEQNKQYKADMRAGRAIAGKKRVERQQKSIERLGVLKPKYLIGPASKKNTQSGRVVNNPLDDKIKRKQPAEQDRLKHKKPQFLKTPTSVKNTNGPRCPDCGAIMSKKEPKQGQNWKPFWGCTQFKSTGCKGSMKA